MRRTHAQAVLADRILAFGRVVPGVFPKQLKQNKLLDLASPHRAYKCKPNCIHKGQDATKNNLLHSEIGRHGSQLRQFCVDFAQKLLQR